MSVTFEHYSVYIYYSWLIMEGNILVNYFSLKAELASALYFSMWGKSIINVGGLRSVSIVPVYPLKTKAAGFMNRDSGSLYQ